VPSSDGGCVGVSTGVVVTDGVVCCWTGAVTGVVGVEAGGVVVVVGGAGGVGLGVGVGFGVGSGVGLLGGDEVPVPEPWDDDGGGLTVCETSAAAGGETL
jgi:hypothetical protein